MAELTNWRPIRDTHAIQACSLAVQFAEPVGDVLWRRADLAISEQAALLGLRDREPIGTSPFPLALQLPFRLEPVPDQGFVYGRRDEAGAIVEQLHAGRDVLKFDQMVYTRWAPFRQRAEQLIASAVDRYAGVSSLAMLTSAYVDVFVFSGDSSDQIDVMEVIESTSPFVTKGSMRARELWHCHTGYFEYPDDVTRRLINVNVDIVPGPIPGEAFQVKISTQVSDQFGQPERLPLNPEEVSWDFISRHADEQHERLKLLLAEVLTSAAARSISLR